MIPQPTDRITCRCGHRVHVIWCADSEWRFFDPVPWPGEGWWWSRRARAMVSGPWRPVLTYRVHRCPCAAQVEAGPVGGPGPVAAEVEQLALFPAPADAPVRGRRRAGGVA